MLYRFIKILISLGIKLYYKEIKIKDKNNLEHDGPKIIIANHPNTMLDAWIIGYITKEPIYFMAKGTFFNTRLKMWFLNSLGLIPINRATESRTKGVSNEASFESCYELLEKGKTLVIFPEGNSFIERQLRVLKSGTARIALEAERRNNAELNVKIIPVGLVYSRAEKFRSSILVNVGEKIDPLPHLELFETSSLKAAKELTEEFRINLEGLLVGSNSTEYENLVDDIVDIISSSYQKSEEKGVQKDVSLIKKTFVRMNEIQMSDSVKFKKIDDLVYRIKRQLEKLEIKSDFLDRAYRPKMFTRQLIQSIILLLIGLPLFLFGAIHSIIPYKLTDGLMPKLVDELNYYAPIAILLGLILYPLNYFGFVVLTNYFIPMELWMKVVYFFSMPLFGMFAFYFIKYITHISFKTNYVFLMKTEKDTINSLRSDREELRDLIFEE